MTGGIDFGCLMNFDCNTCIWVFGGNLPGSVALVLAGCCVLFVGDALDWFGTLMVPGLLLVEILFGFRTVCVLLVFEGC